MMILFWSILSLMTLVAVGFVAWPLLSNRRTDADTRRRDINLALYRERLDEISQSHAAGELDAMEMQAMRDELDSRLLEDAGADQPEPVRAITFMSRKLALVLMAALPILSFGLYIQNSDWELALVGDGPAAVPLLLERLQRHLEQEPGDIEGWRLLASSQAELRQFGDAAESFSRVNALAADADSLVGEAEMRALAAGGNLSGRPEVLLQQALRIAPDHPRVLWYAGLAAQQAGNSNQALKYWYLLYQQDLPDDFRQLLVKQIKNSGGEEPRHKSTGAFGIPLRVILSSELRTQVKPDMPVFIYARAVGSKGPPLAVTRYLVSDLPLSLVLEDKHSMLPSMKLSSVNEWVITARISRQGGAETQPGDPIAQTVVTRDHLRQSVVLEIQNQAP